MKSSSLTFKLFLLLTLVGSLLFGAPTFPELSGRVVDKAHLFDATEVSSLETLLQEHEKATTNQIVVVTLKTLQGYEIEEYGYQLGRYWGIGQKGKDNGILLIVAPNERKVRIEVGYGLEGAMTDKMAHDIIQENILPSFKRNDFVSGVMNGTQAIIAVLNGDYIPAQTNASKSKNNLREYSSLILMILFLLYLVMDLYISKKTKSSKFYWSVAVGSAVAIMGYIMTTSFVMALILGIISFLRSYFFNDGGSSWSSSGNYSSGDSYSSGGGGSFSGGFSGGGGSFGGGGASGSW